MIVLAILFGWLLGIFINLAADSLPGDRRLGRPQCRACGAPRPIPAWSGVVAWFTPQRDCGYCGVRLSLREPVVELLLISAAVVLVQSSPSIVRWGVDLLAIGIMLLITVIDLEHRLILHIVSIPSALYFAVVGVLDPHVGFSRTIVGGLLAFAFFLLLYLLGAAFARWMGNRRGEEVDEVAFGFGDVMLALVIGLAVGFPGVIGALLRGIILAGVFSFIYLLIMSLRKRYEAFTPIPYGPFLIIGALWVYFRGDPALEVLLGY